MKFEIIDKNSFVVKLNNSYKNLNNNQEDIIKNILILMKKRYAYNIYGFYEVNVYKISNFISLLFFKRVNSNDLINNIDLRIINHNTNIDLYIDDYEIIKTNHIKGNDISYDNIYKICEHYSIPMHNLHY